MTYYNNLNSEILVYIKIINEPTINKIQYKKSLVKVKDALNEKGVVKCLNSFNGIDNFFNYGTVTTTSTTTLSKILHTSSAVVNWISYIHHISSLNSIDFFSIMILLLQHWVESFIRPQLSHVGYLISKCNLTVTSCYANIRYNIIYSRFQLSYKVNPYVYFFTNLRSSMTLFKLKLTQLGKLNLKLCIVLICSIKLDIF